MHILRSSHILSRILFLSALVCAGLPTAAIAQGSLTPPGAPGPTMKTLDQIFDAVAGGSLTTIEAADLPMTISSPGSYIFVEAISYGSTAADPLIVDSNNVTIDLNGFSYIGPGTGAGGSIDAIRIINGREGIRVRNGTISGWSGDGISGPATAADRAQGSKFTNLLIHDINRHGIYVGHENIVTNCSVRDCTGTGILGQNRNQILSCSVIGNTQDGIAVNDDGTIQNCAAHLNGESGIQVGDGCRISHNLANINSFAGILILGSGNNASDNQFADNLTRGIFTSAGGNIIVRNVARSNGAVLADDFDLLVSDTIGELLVGPAILTSGNPWANISY